jgi:hypothetical protein
MQGTISSDISPKHHLVGNIIHIGSSVGRAALPVVVVGRIVPVRVVVTTVLSSVSEILFASLVQC